MKLTSCRAKKNLLPNMTSRNLANPSAMAASTWGKHDSAASLQHSLHYASCHHMFNPCCFGNISAWTARRTHRAWSPKPQGEMKHRQTTKHLKWRKVLPWGSPTAGRVLELVWSVGNRKAFLATGWCLREVQRTLMLPITNWPLKILQATVFSHIKILRSLNLKRLT